LWCENPTPKVLNVISPELKLGVGGEANLSCDIPEG
jgi:hypothetical protein